MRGIYSSLTDIRRKVFMEVAKLAYEGNDYARIETLPYKIIPGEIATYRDSVFLERAIVGERIRLCMGLPLRPANNPAPISENIEDSIRAEKYYEPPLINIINFACNSCPEKSVEITNACMGCLAHPCIEICPKDCIQFVDGKAHINQEECIRCGRCKDVCPYGAIIKRERPCAQACGMDAIESDDFGRAKINYDKCVSCGMCLVNCPFGAIADKSQIFQLIQSIKKKDKVIAAIAPAFVGQFGPQIGADKLLLGMKQLGFHDMVEVAIGADLCTLEEAEDFIQKVPHEQPFMATSCCPSWSMMAKKTFPEFTPYISMALTPMVLTARLIKEKHPDAKVVFIGPCAAKKLEASRTSVRSEVDFVLTFEELAALFAAKDIDLSTLQGAANTFTTASADGRGFAISNGVASAVVNVIKKKHPTMEVKTVSAQGLRNCKQMLAAAKSGKYDGYLLEGMGCPGGCVAGAGTLQNIVKSTALVNKYKNDCETKNASDNKYKDELHTLIHKFDE